MSSSNRVKVTRQYAEANCTTRNFHHPGHGIYYEGLPPPGAPYSTGLIGPDAAAWKAESTKEKQQARFDAAEALVQLQQAPVVYAPSATSSEQPRRSLMLRIRTARSLMGRLRVPKTRLDGQTAEQEQVDASDDADGTAPAPQDPTSNSPAPAPPSRTQRFPNKVSDLAKRATGRKPDSTSSTSSPEPGRDTKRPAFTSPTGALPPLRYSDNGSPYLANKSRDKVKEDRETLPVDRSGGPMVWEVDGYPPGMTPAGASGQGGGGSSRGVVGQRRGEGESDEGMEDGESMRDSNDS